MQTVEPIRKKADIEQVKILLKRRRKRDYILFVLGINCGLRISDLLKLRVKDVRNKQSLVIVEQKTGKIRKIPIKDMLRCILRDYIKGKNDEQWLFKSQKGNNRPISRIQAYRIITSVCKKAGLSENFGTHTLRKTFGYHFYQMTKDVALLQNILNHSSPKVTLRYIGINQDIIESQLSRFLL